MYLELSSLGIGNMNCSCVCDLLSELVCNIFSRTLEEEKKDCQTKLTLTC